MTLLLMDNWGFALYNFLNLRYPVAPIYPVCFCKMMHSPITQTHEDRLRAFTEVAAALNSSLCLDDVLQRVLGFAALLVPLPPAHTSCIALFDAASTTWRIP